MARNLSSTVTTTLGQVYTSPRYLVKISLPNSVTLRYSSTQSNVSYNNETWIPGRFTVSGLSFDILANNGGQLVLGTDPDNPDLIFAYALRDDYGFTNAPIEIWVFDNTLVNSNGVLSEPIKVFNGMGDSVSISANQVTINLTTPNSKYLFAPRVFINATNGFNWLQPKGTRIPWGNEIFVLE